MPEKRCKCPAYVDSGFWQRHTQNRVYFFGEGQPWPKMQRSAHHLTQGDPETLAGRRGGEARSVGPDESSECHVRPSQQVELFANYNINR